MIADVHNKGVAVSELLLGMLALTGIAIIMISLIGVIGLLISSVASTRLTIGLTTGLAFLAPLTSTIQFTTYQNPRFILSAQVSTFLGLDVGYSQEEISDLFDYESTSLTPMDVLNDVNYDRVPPKLLRSNNYARLLGLPAYEDFTWDGTETNKWQNIFNIFISNPAIFFAEPAGFALNFGQTTNQATGAGLNEIFFEKFFAEQNSRERQGLTRYWTSRYVYLWPENDKTLYDDLVYIDFNYQIALMSTNLVGTAAFGKKEIDNLNDIGFLRTDLAFRKAKPDEAIENVFSLANGQSLGQHVFSRVRTFATMINAIFPNGLDNSLDPFFIQTIMDFFPNMSQAEIEDFIEQNFDEQRGTINGIFDIFNDEGLSQLIRSNNVFYTRVLYEDFINPITTVMIYLSLMILISVASFFILKRLNLS